MGRNIFLSVLTLIAGICLGVLGALTLIEPAPAVQPAGNLLASPVVTSTPAPTASVSPTQEIRTDVPLPVTDLKDNRALLSLAFDVVAALKGQDYQALSACAHPDGVVFTPYSTVDLEANLCFTPSQIAALKGDTTKYIWGISDGKGDPLELTAGEYFARYVYNADYMQAPMLGLDKVLGSGNALENVFEIFPHSRFVEFYFPGIVPEYNGFDWCGLKLVFSQYKDQYKLRAVIHSEWTI